jgi:RNA polymerase sigma-70 factor (ECF subfamily)
VLKGLMDTDTALAARLARDLDAAFPDLVAGHADRLYTIALRLLGDRSDAEEVAQDALVRAHRAMAGYPPARVAALKLRPWLAAIAVNLARNRRRNIADRHPAESLEPLAEAGFDPRDDGAADPPRVAAGRESADELAALLLRLPGPVRLAIVLRHVDGLSVAETAEALGRPEGTIKAQVSRGLDRLRELLELPPDERPGLGPRQPRPQMGRAATTPARSPAFPDVMGGRILAAAEVH